MPKIPSYPLAEAISNEDLLVMDDASAQYATKSLELQLLKGFINTGQATTTYVADQVVTGASFNTGTGMLTLTRNGGEIPSVTTPLDGRYALTTSLAAVATSGSYNDLLNKPTIPPAYTNADVDAHLNTDTATASQVLSWTGSDYDWVAQSGGGGGVTSIIAGTGISILPGTGVGDVQITNTLALQSAYDTASFFSGSGGNDSLGSLFNGNASDQRILLQYPDTDKLWVVLDLIAYLDTSGGTYTADGDLYVGPNVAIPSESIGIKIPATFLNSTTNKVIGIRCAMDYEVAENDIKGTNLVLKAFSTPVSISSTGATLKISYTRRLLTNLFD
jgi:hypothetical protein